MSDTTNHQNLSKETIESSLRTITNEGSESKIELSSEEKQSLSHFFDEVQGELVEQSELPANYQSQNVDLDEE
jgi:hypothetical protein